SRSFPGWAAAGTRGPTPSRTSATRSADCTPRPRYRCPPRLAAPSPRQTSCWRPPLLLPKPVAVPSASPLPTGVSAPNGMLAQADDNGNHPQHHLKLPRAALAQVTTVPVGLRNCLFGATRDGPVFIQTSACRTG